MQVIPSVLLGKRMEQVLGNLSPAPPCDPSCITVSPPAYYTFCPQQVVMDHNTVIAMKHENTKAPTLAEHSSGLHNDFSEQEETMTNSAMPPAFALTAGTGMNPGNAQSALAHAEPTSMIHIAGMPPELVEKLCRFEGIKWKSYRDSLGKPTGGLGHLLVGDELTKYPIGTPLAKSVVEAWAQQDVGMAWKAGQQQAKELGVDSHDFKVALASMSFQNGSYWHTVHVNTWALMKAHKWEAAAEEAADSEWARQTPTRLEDFQAALRKLSVAQGGNIAEPFRRKVAEAKDIAKGKQPTVRPPSKSSGVPPVPTGTEGMKQIQLKLQAWGLYDGKIDGIATSSKGESKTTAGIKKFQHMKGITPTGTVDERTWAALNGGPADDGTIWERFMAGMGNKQKQEVKKEKPEKGWGSEPKGKEEKKEGNTVGEDGWTIEPLLGAEDFYSQLHAARGAEKPVPRANAFSGALKQYDHGESADIYDDAKCKKAWRNLSIQEREIKVYNYACKNTCDFIVRNNGFESGGSETSIYSLLEKKDGEKTSLEIASTHQEAKSRLDSYLEAGVPTVVGMDWKSKGANKGSPTDHFVIVVGRGEDAKGKFYQYMDVARSKTAAGVDYVQNRVYIGYGKNDAQQENWISGQKPGTKAYYSLSEVRTMREIK